jgi:DNA-directed RNA polymerase specialized sigma24 family protein
LTEERAAGPGGPDDDPAGGGDPAELVRRALGGDRAAWDGIVGRFGDRVWAICRAYRLGPAEAADVYQQTWLRVLVADADQGRPSYQMAAAALGIPVGSLGPTRARCLSRLREFLTTGIGGPPGASSQ